MTNNDNYISHAEKINFYTQMMGKPSGIIRTPDTNDFDNLEHEMKLAFDAGFIFINEPNWMRPPIIMEIDESGRIVNGNLEQENTDGRC